MKENNEKKDYKFLWIGLCFVLLVSIIVSGSMTKRINSLENKINTLKSDVEISFKDAYYSFDVLETELRTENQKLKNQIANLWFSGLDEKAFDNLEKFNEENKEFMKCEQYDDVYVANWWFGLNMEYAGYYIMTNENGYKVVLRNGSVFCYDDVIETTNPEMVNCTHLCGG